MFLTTPSYTKSNYRVGTSDVEDHIPWMASINSRLPVGSNYTVEIGHNGNGNIGICPCCVIPCVSLIAQVGSTSGLTISSNSTKTTRDDQLTVILPNFQIPFQVQIY